MQSICNKDLILELSMVIPCAHIPREFIADRVIKHFVKYLDEQSQSNKTINQVLFEITSDEKYNA
jgi:hypothetical protein